MTERSSPREARRVQPQSAACDRCSQGVMDSENSHMWGRCPCECHWPSLASTPTWALEARVEEWVRNG
jgi:hypothetical protein